MAVYQYTAVDSNGSKFSGSCEDIDSIATLRVELAKMGDTLIKAKPAKKSQTKRKKVKPVEVVTFTYKLAGMCSAGLSITKSLESLEGQTDNSTFKNIIADVRESIETGSTLKSAFAQHRDVFSGFFLGMVEAGESGGKLSEVLESSAVYLEKQAELRRRVKSAFAYPIVVGVMCLLVVTGLVVFVIPVFQKLYERLHVALPMPTQVLITLSVLVRYWWWAIICFVVIMVVLLKRLSKKPQIRARWDTFKLKMPIFANLQRMIVVARFMRTFAMLISAGVSFTKAMEVANEVAHNAKVSEIAQKLQKSIETGSPLATALKQHDLFPQIIVQLAESGEEAGKLAIMLNKGVDFLDRDIERTINSLLLKLEPAMTVIMGAIVGFILMGVYLPMFDYMNHLSK